MKKFLANQRSSALNNEKGVALMMALFSIIFISFLATELGFEARTEYQFSNAIYHETKAYYAAKSAVDLSLFRIFIFRKAKEAAGDKLPDPSLLDKIWSFPFVWPPFLPADASLIAKDDLKTVLGESLQDAEWTSMIEPESSLIDINDLDSPSEALAKSTAEQIVQLIKNRIEKDDEWADEHSNIDPEVMVQHMKDFIDADEESAVGGGESSYYQDTEYKSSMPPNRPFRTIDELRLIPDMDDTLFEHLAPSFSLYGSKGINVNFASTEVLMSIDPQVTAEIAKNIKDRIVEEGAFKNEKELIDFLSSYLNSSSFNPSKVPLIFEEESAFRISTTGSYGKSTKSITAIVFDYAKIQDRFAKSLAEQLAPAPGSPSNPPVDPAKPPPTNPNQQANQNTESLTKKAPTIVFWEED